MVAIIGPTGTGDSLAIVDACRDGEIPLISCAAGVSIVTPTETNDKHWIFTTPQLSVMVVQRLYEYLGDQGITKIALLTDTLGFGKDGKANLNGQAGIWHHHHRRSGIWGDRCRYADTAYSNQELKSAGNSLLGHQPWASNCGPQYDHAQHDGHSLILQPRHCLPVLHHCCWRFCERRDIPMRKAASC